jgi:hypothetical protein
MYPKQRTTGRDRVMSGSYTAFEVEAERRQELAESSVREAVERQTLREADRPSRITEEVTQGRGLAEAAASLFNRVSQRA